MVEQIDQALLSCIHDHYLISHDDELASIKIALIGEENMGCGENTLVYKLTHYRFGIKDITVFTRKNKFTVKDGKQFDLLIGCRPCSAEGLILKSATKYSKRFIIMPCACDRFRKIPDYIRKYPIISNVAAYPPQRSVSNATPEYNSDRYSVPAWVILFNTRYDSTTKKRGHHDV